MNLTTPAVVLEMMIDAEGTAAATASPYRPTYERTADAIAIVANRWPIFAGDDGPLRSAALYVSLSWFEARFEIGALGDCRKKDERGHCLGEPQSLGLFQIGISNFESLVVTPEEMTTDPLTQTFAARQMTLISFGVCRGRNEDAWLSQYATGGGSCVEAGVEKSRHRMLKAKWLFARRKAAAVAR